MLIAWSILKAGTGRLSQTWSRQVSDTNYSVLWAGSLLEPEVFLAAVPPIKLICILICFLKNRRFQSIYFADINCRAVRKQRLPMLGSWEIATIPPWGSCSFGGCLPSISHACGTVVEAEPSCPGEVGVEGAWLTVWWGGGKGESMGINTDCSRCSDILIVVWERARANINSGMGEGKGYLNITF